MGVYLPLSNMFARKKKHIYQGLHSETNSDRKGEGFRCGSLSLCEGQGGKVR